MKKIINSLFILLAIAVATTACGKFPEPPEPNPLEPALFIYYYPCLMNDVALVPTNLAKRLELYIDNGATEDARKKVLNGVTVSETGSGTNVWDLDMISVPIGVFPVSGGIRIDMSNPEKILIVTKGEGLTVGGSVLLTIPVTDSYEIYRTSGVWTIDYLVSMKHSSSTTSYMWMGDLVLLDAESNTTDIAKLEELKYVIETGKSSGQVALGDGTYITLGMKVDYEVVEPLHYARAVGTKGGAYTKLTSGRDRTIPYNDIGMPMINHTVDVEYVNQSPDPFNVAATKVIYYYQDIVKEMN